MTILDKIKFKVLKLLASPGIPSPLAFTLSQTASDWHVSHDDLRDALKLLWQDHLIQIEKYSDESKSYVEYSGRDDGRFFCHLNVQLRLLASGKEQFQRMASGGDMKDVELQDLVLKCLYENCEQLGSFIGIYAAGEAIGVLDHNRLDIAMFQLKRKGLLEIGGTGVDDSGTMVGITPEGREFVEGGGTNGYLATVSQTFHIGSVGSMQVANAPGATQNVISISGSQVWTQIERAIQNAPGISPEEKKGLLDKLKQVANHPLVQAILSKSLEVLMKSAG